MNRRIELYDKNALLIENRTLGGCGSDGTGPRLGQRPARWRRWLRAGPSVPGLTAFPGMDSMGRAERMGSARPSAPPSTLAAAEPVDDGAGGQRDGPSGEILPARAGEQGQREPEREDRDGRPAGEADGARAVAHAAPQDRDGGGRADVGGEPRDDREHRELHERARDRQDE